MQGQRKQTLEMAVYSTGISPGLIAGKIKSTKMNLLISLLR